MMTHLRYVAIVIIDETFLVEEAEIDWLAQLAGYFKASDAQVVCLSGFTVYYA